ncbi:MAG: NfeD family protein [Hallerella porci]|uniref:Membrane-bound serine protease (ClpP class) n=1 Tax=Hallerella porci TaxID=1945871 RepID=A0ABX5LKV9_9BACT|nr:NfeD family protein [Hallerella porci]MDY3922402.1 NfeD family protein [Hallerella porci]PWK95157.1 membrane-bound serine protease (ClpP class) [Hallerella porci]
MKKSILLIFLLLLSFAGIASAKTAAWISLEGDVDPGMYEYTARAIGDAVQKNPDYIIFDINTFGGRLDAAFDIVDTIMGIKNAKTIAFVSKKAISAGALIALSSKELYMLPGTTIGDCAPIVQNSDGTPQIVGEKIQSPLRAKFRNLAQKNNYPELLSMAMVSPDLSVLELKHKDSTLAVEAAKYEKWNAKEKAFWGTPKVLVEAGELLTMTDEEAVALHFSKGTPESRDAFEKSLEIEATHEIEITWSEKLARFIANISGILLILGFGALYLEFKTPGFGIFGVVGILLIATVFLGQYANHLDDFLPAIFLVLGIGLFVLEILVFPGTFFFGIGGIFCMGIALVLTFDITSIPAFIPGGNSSAILPILFYIIGCALLATIFPIVASKYLIPLLPEGWTPMLKADLETAKSPTENVALVQVGEKGKAETLLRPVGHARFNGKSFDVQTKGEMINAGETVCVIEISDGRIWVEKSEDFSVS